MKILGIHPSFNAHNHDPSATLLIRGKIVGAMEEERFNRVKTSLGYFPYHSVKNLLEDNNLKIKDIDLVVTTGITYPVLKKKISNQLFQYFGYSPKVIQMPHYLAHAYGAYFSSGFEKSLVVSIDAMGDNVSMYVANANKQNLKELYRSGQGLYKESLGVFYSAFAEFLGWKRSEGEFKMMGMAAYGKKIINLNKFANISKKNFKININPKLTNLGKKKLPITCAYEPMVNFDYLIKKNHLKNFFKASSQEKFNQNHFDLAYSVQKKYEEILIETVLKFKGNNKNLCLSGGCALNCLANSYLENFFDNIYVMPAASDRGLSIGCAYYGAIASKKKTFPVKSMFLGKAYSQKNILRILKMSGVKFFKCDSNLEAAKDLINGKIIGWFKGRSEFGPRALGGRSILALANKKGIKDEINKKIKFREKFRPFAPVTLKRFIEKFDIKKDYPYMNIAIFPDVTLSKKLGEALHADGSVRLQTVNSLSHPLYKLLNEIDKKSVDPVLINTSFNISGEPIVESPRDAIRTFFSCGIDVLYIENYKIIKNT